jgi:ribonuclease PH
MSVTTKENDISPISAEVDMNVVMTGEGKLVEV